MRVISKHNLELLLLQISCHGQCSDLVPSLQGGLLANFFLIFKGNCLQKVAVQLLKESQQHLVQELQ